MDPVDVLTIATHAAQMIRTGKDPEKIIQGAYKALKLPRPEDGEDSLALRIVRLTEAAGGEREKLMQYLSKHMGSPLINRPAKGWGGAVEPGAVGAADDAEAEELLEYVESEEESARDMMGNFPSVAVADKRVSGFFGGRTIIIRKGKRLTEEKAGKARAGDQITMEKEGLPQTVRGLIDYPLERPCLFTIHVGDEPWSVWDVCCAIADQYARIYEEPDKYGIEGHDLGDLWIEGLLYYPEKRLIYPHIGS
jgi:hypothetical protein